MAHVLAARVCFHHLHLVRDGLEYAEHAVQNYRGHSQAVRSRAHLILGWGYSLRARESKLLDVKKRDEKLALDQFEEAVKRDPRDYQVSHAAAFIGRFCASRTELILCFYCKVRDLLSLNATDWSEH